MLALHEGLNQELKHRYGEAGRCIDTSVVHPMWARTAIIDSWESSLSAAKTAVLSPVAIADRVVEQILSGRGGQIYVPASATNFSGLRGWPTWVCASVASCSRRFLLTRLVSSRSRSLFEILRRLPRRSSRRRVRRSSERRSMVGIFVGHGFLVCKCVEISRMVITSRYIYSTIS